MRRRPLVPLFLTVLIDLVGFGILMPLQPYLALEFGASKSGVTGLNWSYSAAQFLMAPIWGRLSDRWGRRPILLVSIGGSIFSQLFFAATQLFHRGLPPEAGLALLYVARIGAGICAANVATAQAYIADSTAPENRARGMGLLFAAFGLGFIVGPAIGGALDRFGHAVPLLFAAGLSALNLLAAWLWLPESLTPEKRGQLPAPSSGSRLRILVRSLSAPRLGPLLLLQFAIVWAFSNMESTLALLLFDRFGWQAANVGKIFAFSGLVLVLMQGGLVGRLSRRFGERTLLLVGIGGEVLSLAAIPFASSSLEIYLALGSLAASSSLCNPSLSSLISRNSKAENQGHTLGLGASMSSLGRILGPLWGGLTYDRFGYASPYLSAATAMGLALFYGLLRVPRSPSLRPEEGLLSHGET